MPCSHRPPDPHPAGERSPCRREGRRHGSQLVGGSCRVGWPASRGTSLNADIQPASIDMCARGVEVTGRRGRLEVRGRTKGVELHLPCSTVRRTESSGSRVLCSLVYCCYADIYHLSLWRYGVRSRSPHRSLRFVPLHAGGR